MNSAHPLQYLRVTGFDPKTRMVCAMPNCDNKFVAEDGVAFEGKNTSQGDAVHIYLFCSYGCYLSGLPAQCCARC